MTFRICANVRELLTVTGTGAITTGTPANGAIAFSAVPGIATNDLVPYMIVDTVAGTWEAGTATYNSTGPTLTRTTVSANSSGTTSALTFGGNVCSVLLVRGEVETLALIAGAYANRTTLTTGSVTSTSGTNTVSATVYSQPGVKQTGVLSADTVYVVPNSWLGTWENASTGAFKTTVKTASGTGVVVPQGATLGLLADGTNVVAENASSVLTITTTTTVPVPTGVTGAWLKGSACGGPGGGGANQVNSSQASGGAGGGGGSYCPGIFLTAAELGTSLVVTIPTTPTGGAGAAASSTAAGSAGAGATEMSIGNKLFLQSGGAGQGGALAAASGGGAGGSPGFTGAASVGAAGAGGATSGGAGGAGGSGIAAATAQNFCGGSGGGGCSAAGVAGAGGNSGTGNAGGGAGGGIGAANASNNGAAGGLRLTLAAGGQGAGSSSAGAAGSTGTSNATYMPVGGSGGGFGNGNAGAGNGAGSNGGSASTGFGGGGGGGGAGTGTGKGGNGGDGGAAFAQIVWQF